MRNHLRSNIVGYVALFFALSSSALAANTVFSEDIVNGEVKTADLATVAVTGPKIRADAVSNAKLADDAVTRTEILDGGVTSAELFDGDVANADLADGAVGTTKVQDGAVTSAKVLDDTLTATDIATNGVNSAEIATDAVAATEIQNDSIDAGEVVDFGLSNQDVGVLFAEVQANGTLDNSSGANNGTPVTVTKLGGTGNYEVDFARTITTCTSVATIGPSGGGSVAGEVNVADRGGNVEAVFVDTNNSAGTATDLPFRLVVVC